MPGNESSIHYEEGTHLCLSASMSGLTLCDRFATWSAPVWSSSKNTTMSLPSGMRLNCILPVRLRPRLNANARRISWQDGHYCRNERASTMACK